MRNFQSRAAAGSDKPRHSRRPDRAQTPTPTPTPAPTPTDPAAPTAPTPAPTAGEIAASLRDHVQQLHVGRVIDNGTTRQLVSTIDAFTASIARSNGNSARGQIGAFENQVRAGYRSRKLDASTAATLLDFAVRIRAAL